MSGNIKNISNKRQLIIFILLLLYSLLPGIYKVLGNNQLIMLFSIPIVLVLLFFARREYKVIKLDIVFIIFFSYVILQSILWFFSPWVNRMGILMGIYLNIFPMLGFFISRSMDLNVFKDIILYVVLVHCIIGIVLYPFFGIVNANSPIVKALTEGVAYGRMSSVAGSLIYGNLMLIGFIISFFTKRKYLPLILFCLIFNDQRSEWLAAKFSILIYLLFLLKSSRVKTFITYIMSFLLAAIMIIFLISNYIDFDTDFMLARFTSIGEASSERDGQWVSGIENFISYPLGTGVGQVGHVAVRYEEATSVYKGVPDGDYFRLLSEYGFIGGLFYLFIILSVFISFIYMKRVDKIFIVTLIAGNLIQMIGSNISEFYWIIFGYYFSFLNNNYKIRV